MDDSALSRVVASAAALVATVCAEAAESVGASKAHVAAVISSGIATQSSADIAALTSMAATSKEQAPSILCSSIAILYCSSTMLSFSLNHQLDFYDDLSFDIKH